MERWEGGNEDILGWCIYCKECIREGEGHICINGDYYHYDISNPLKNCFYPELLKEEED